MHRFSKVRLENDYIVDMNIVLGKGSTGCVYEGYDQRTKAKVAVKVIQLSTIDNEVTEYLLKMEKKALMQLASPYVLKGLRIFQDDRFCFMVTQFCNGGTLKKLIKDQGFLSQQRSLKIVKQLLQGYKNLVDHKVVHRDLKPANIMMHNDSPKIIDFGYCEIQGYQKPRLEYNVGSPSYMAPESYQLNVYNQKTQIWSIGVILYQCLTGRTIDEGIKMTEIYKIMERTGIPYPDYVSTFCREIINWCLSKDPRKRPTCSQLLQKYFGVRSLNMIDLPNQIGKVQQNKDRLTEKTIDSERSARNLAMTASNIFTSQSVFGGNSFQAIKTTQYIDRPKTVNPAFENNAELCQPVHQTNRMRAAFSVHEKSSKGLPFFQPYIQSNMQQNLFNKHSAQQKRVANQHQNLLRTDFMGIKQNRALQPAPQHQYFNNPYNINTNAQRHHYGIQIPVFNPNSHLNTVQGTERMPQTGAERIWHGNQRAFGVPSQTYAQRQRTVSFRI